MFVSISIILALEVQFSIRKRVISLETVGVSAIEGRIHVISKREETLLILTIDNN